MSSNPKVGAGTIGRRALLGGMLAAVPVMAEAGLSRSIRPLPRGGTVAPAATGSTVAARSGPTVESILKASGLANNTGFMVADLASGRLLESHRAEVAMPPASVSKAITTLYALDALGAGHRFRTRLLATGPIRDGRIAGDLILAGGGDPAMDSDGLAKLAAALKSRGVYGVTGRFLVSGTALPYVEEIDPEQPDDVGYNPSVSGLNLNFNRVHFQWRRGADGYATSMIARGEKFAPAVTGIRVALADRRSPVFRYALVEGHDYWTVARGALGKDGSRWLPVRRPVDYAGETFRILAESQGVRLPSHAEIGAPPAGATEIAAEQSATLEAQLRTMLKWSTNLTAEVAGLAATQAALGQVASLQQSAEAMTRWFRARYGLSRARFENHSGLTDASEMTAAEMVQFLDSAGQSGPLPAMMKVVPINQKGQPAPKGVEVRAKTGTLNFARALAGYVHGPNGRRLAFAIFAADMAARSKLRPEDAERPEGGRGWINRAVAQERALLRRWAETYATGV